MDCLWVVLAFALAVGMVVSSNSRLVSHDVTELAQIIAEHDDEIASHDHAQDEIADVRHAYHGHVHDVADHDHTVSFLPPHEAAGFLEPKRANWALARYAMLDRRDFDLDRPPRV